MSEERAHYGPPPNLYQYAHMDAAAREGLGPPNKDCKCPTPQASMFCMTGHMLECHYPLSCREAQCSHFAAAQLEELEDA